MDYQTLKSNRQLFQVKPPNTNAYTVFSKSTHRKCSILNLTVVNTTSSAALFSLYIDKGGTTYDSSTALYYNNSIAANTTALIEYNHGLPLDHASNVSIGVQSGTANAITITANGIEF